MVTRETPVEEIVKLTGIIGFCIQHGFSPVNCDGVYPGQLGKLLEVTNIPDPDGFIEELNQFIAVANQRA